MTDEIRQDHRARDFRQNSSNRNDEGEQGHFVANENRGGHRGGQRGGYRGGNQSGPRGRRGGNDAGFFSRGDEPAGGVAAMDSPNLPPARTNTEEYKGDNSNEHRFEDDRFGTNNRRGGYTGGRGGRGGDRFQDPAGDGQSFRGGRGARRGGYHENREDASHEGRAYTGFTVASRDQDDQPQRVADDAAPREDRFAPRRDFPNTRGARPPRDQNIDLKPLRYEEARVPAARPTRRPEGREGAPESQHSVAELHVATRTERAPRNRRNNFDEAETEQLFETRHNQRGISFDNYESIAVEIVPNDIDAVKSFEGLGIHPLLDANLRRCGYTKPTPVQKYGIPVCLAGKDLMACAQTGSGKTAAFLIPVVQHLLVHGVSPGVRRCSYPIALIMAPTRELALQIYDESRKLAFKTDIWCDVVYGGTSYPHNFEQDILVACPGRLTDIFDRESVSFSKIKFLILDEADRMLEMGFEEQIEYLVGSTETDMPPPEQRQTLMFSATFPVPIRNLAQKYLRRQYYLLTVGRVGSTTRNIKQRLMYVEEKEKQDTLMNLLFEQDQTDLVLVFVETKAAAEDLYAMLYDQGIPSSTIHGGRKQFEREEALKRFKDGRTPILVATDVASRGLDIPNVAHVIQYDLPRSMDDYTHRIGRTARAGNAGNATAFFNGKDAPLTEELVAYLREHDQDVPEWMENLREERDMHDFVKGQQRRGGRGGRGGARPRYDDAPTTWDSEDSHRPQGGGRSRGGRDGGAAPAPKQAPPPKKVNRIADGGF